MGRAKAQMEESDLQDGKEGKNLDNVTRVPRASVPEAIALVFLFYELLSVEFLPLDIELRQNKSAWYLQCHVTVCLGIGSWKKALILRKKFFKPTLDQLSVIPQRKGPMFKKSFGKSGLTTGNLPLSLPDDTV